MKNEFDFSGRAMLVTGSGRNLGRAIVLEFAARGANVVINARSNVDEAESVKREAEAFGVKAIVVMGSPHEKPVVEELKAKSEAAFGRVDFYVSNAARRLHKDFLETSDEEWHFHLNQQLTASWYLAKAFAPAMKAAGHGRIIHMNGPDGYSGDWTRAPHSAAKAALRTLTKSMAKGLGAFGVTVNDINPGYSETVRDPVTHPTLVDPEKLAALHKRIPIGRGTAMGEVAFAAAFLCSPRAAAINGSIIHVDGGLHMLG